jgi:hypothetical protein
MEHPRPFWTWNVLIPSFIRKTKPITVIRPSLASTLLEHHRAEVEEVFGLYAGRQP